MKKAKEAFKRFKNKYGWKTITGIILHAVWGSIHLTNGKINFDIALQVHGGIGTLTGVGLGDKVRKFAKSDNGKKLLKLITKK
jgi:hypothetical protein